MLEESSARDRALLERGIDIWMIRDNLRVSPEVRVARHQDTLDTIHALQRMRQQRRPPRVFVRK